MLKQSATSAVVQVIVAVLLGLFALPAIVDGGSIQATSVGGSPATPAVIWLVGALVISVWLVVSGPALGAGITHLLERLVAPEGASVGRQSVTRAGAGVAAGWIVAVVEVVLIQAVLRRPVVLVVGALTDPSTVEAAFAAGTLILLILLLIWLHRSTRPLVEAATWQALDVLVATSGSERAQALAEEADTRLATALASTHRGTEIGGERTVPRNGAPETVLAASADATRLAPGTATVSRASEPTRPAWEDAPTISDDVTIRAAPPDDVTLADSDKTRPG